PAIFMELRSIANTWCADGAGPPASSANALATTSMAAFAIDATVRTGGIAIMSDTLAVPFPIASLDALS
ncbi:MAG TPA: hypothetical protein VI282_20940, partial [Verrucomicrobiae bacterium]